MTKQVNLITSTLIGESFISPEGFQFAFNDFITSTGLQIKSDPGNWDYLFVPFYY